MLVIDDFLKGKKDTNREILQMLTSELCLHHLKARGCRVGGRVELSTNLPLRVLSSHSMRK